jgi:hypothetical protein
LTSIEIEDDHQSAPGNVQSRHSVASTNIPRDYPTIASPVRSIIPLDQEQVVKESPASVRSIRSASARQSPATHSPATHSPASQSFAGEYFERHEHQRDIVEREILAGQSSKRLSPAKESPSRESPAGSISSKMSSLRESPAKSTSFRISPLRYSPAATHRSDHQQEETMVIEDDILTAEDKEIVGQQSIDGVEENKSLVDQEETNAQLPPISETIQQQKETNLVQEEQEFERDTAETGTDVMMEKQAEITSTKITIEDVAEEDVEMHEQEEQNVELLVSVTSKKNSPAMQHQEEVTEEAHEEEIEDSQTVSDVHQGHVASKEASPSDEETSAMDRDQEDVMDEDLALERVKQSLLQQNDDVVQEPVPDEEDYIMDSNHNAAAPATAVAEDSTCFSPIPNMMDVDMDDQIDYYDYDEENAHFQEEEQQVEEQQHQQQGVPDEAAELNEEEIQEIMRMYEGRVNVTHQLKIIKMARLHLEALQMITTDAMIEAK